MRAFALASIAFVVACSNPYTTTDEASCNALAAAQCAKVDSCDQNGVTNAYGDDMTCESRYLALCKAQFEATDTSSQEGLVDSCTVSLANASCGDFAFGTISECAPVAGKRGVSKACAFDSQCVTAFCALGKNSACGTCEQLSNAGTDCTSTICSPGFVCSASNQCVPYGAPGADCNANEPCAYASSCVTAAGQMNGICTLQAMQAGAACDPTLTTNPDCDAHLGLACDPATNKCVALTYVTAGQACGNVSGTLVACSKQSSCINGMCVALAADGATCDTAAGPACIAPAICVTSGSTAGTCKLRDGAACN